MIDVPVDALPLHIWAVHFAPKPGTGASPTLVTCRSEKAARDVATQYDGWDATVYEATITWEQR